MADYNSTNTGAVIDASVDAVEFAKAATATDTTAGRLLKVGDFGLTGSNVATVANNALIEFGSNANGSFTKFPDGTLICRVARASTINIQSSAGVLFKSGGLVWTYPSNFLSRPTLSGTVISTDNTSILNVKFINSLTTGFGVAYLITNSESTTNTSVEADLIAIGRWK